MHDKSARNKNHFTAKHHIWANLFIREWTHSRGKQWVISPHPSLIRLRCSQLPLWFTRRKLLKWGVTANYRSSWGPLPPHRLGSPIQVAPTVITPDLAHSKVTEIGTDVVFVSRASEGGIDGSRSNPPPAPQSTCAEKERWGKKVCSRGGKENSTPSINRYIWSLKYQPPK